MADSRPLGDQPRADSRSMMDTGRNPSLSYRVTPIKSTNPRQQRRPSRS